MKSKKLNLLWTISMMVVGITTLILAGLNIVKFELSDIAIRIIGVIDILALPVLAFTTVKKVKKQ